MASREARWSEAISRDGGSPGVLTRGWFSPQRQGGTEGHFHPRAVYQTLSIAQNHDDQLRILPLLFVIKNPDALEYFARQNSESLFYAFINSSFTYPTYYEARRAPSPVQVPRVAKE